MPVLDQINSNNGQSNRVFDALLLYAEKEAQFNILNPVGGRDLHAAALKLLHYTHIKNAYRKKANKSEKQSLRYVRAEIAKLKARLNPTLLNRILYSNAVNIIRNFLKRRTRLFAAHSKPLAAKQKTLIQEDNLQSLNESLKKAGFKFQIDGALKKNMDQGFPQFHLPYADPQNKDAYYILHFNKLPGTDQYYFEKFDAIARPSLDALLNEDGNAQRLTFSMVSKDELFNNASQAGRLVNGKWICGPNDDWYGLGYIGYNTELQKAHFNIEKELSKLPLAIKGDSVKYDLLLKDLKDGKMKEVTLLINDKPVKYKLEACPYRNTIDVLNNNGELVDTAKLFSGKVNQVAVQIIEKQNQKEEIIDMGHVQGVKHR